MPQPPRRLKRSLLNTGGTIHAWGEPEIAKKLAECMEVDPEVRLPFTHGFHTYPARMHPSIAERAIALFGGKSGRVLDPFVGSGTVAVESVRAGRAFSGVDVSAVALEIAWARTRFLKLDDSRLVEREGADIASRAVRVNPGDIPAPPWGREVESWFSPHTLREVALVSLMIDDIPREDLRRILRVVLSSILIRLSKQASDSITVVDRNWEPWPHKATYRMFADKCRELAKSYQDFSKDIRDRDVTYVEPEFWLADAREVKLPKAAFSIGVTSPPYPGTYDYSFHHFLRYPLFGEDPGFVRHREIGARRDFKTRPDALDRYTADMTQCVKNALEALAPGAPLLLLIGDGRFGTRDVRADLIVRGIAATLGARVPAGASQERTEWSKGASSRSKAEHFILVQRP
ncbi:MAG: site-specific DNA-methyltransferase [Planctomycetes bacterium]|nr:site-specific DNA-methyltransferase [Planctomycetota bacterium]